MDYEQKCKEYLERAKEQLNGAKVFDYDNEQIAHDIRTTVYNIFPQLKESEDEGIRKELITHCRNTRCVTEEGAERIAKWIAWIEKQGDKPQGKTALEAIKEEKVDNANKVEPKFKVGDWVVVNNKHQSIYQVEKIEDGYYILRHTHGGTFRVCVLHDESIRLWTIQDAKKGHVLVCKGNIKNSNGIKYERICLFNNLDNAFFTLTKLSNFVEEYDIDVNIDYPDNTVPATKEQKEILFMAMADAGYTFDFDKNKKGLKKIEQNPALSEEDEEKFSFIRAIFIDAKSPNNCASISTYYRDVTESIEWLKSLEERVGNFDDGYKVGFSAAKHNQWKPSEDQIEILNMVLTNESMDDNVARILRELREQLKKLREE